MLKNEFKNVREDPDIQLTKAEKLAKELFIRLHTQGVQIPCTLPPEDFGLPPWYDEEKFKRGQKYYVDNNFGILTSNLFSIASFLSISKDLKILIETGKTSNPETAQKRYLDTIFYIHLWYKSDMKLGSKSFENLRKVRKAHYYASEKAKAKGISPINSADLSMTVFVFIGFVLTRPSLLAINDDRVGREGFIHMWAVFCYMLGVKDEMNMCLLPCDSVIIFCQMVTRYILIPLIQIENQECKRMIQIFSNVVQRYSSMFSVELVSFGSKRLLEIPGYQQGLDKSKEVLCRSLLSQEELNLCTEMIRKYDKSHEFFLFRDIPVFGVLAESNERKTDRFVKQFKNNIVVNDKCNAVSEDCIGKLRRQMDLSDNQGLMIEFIRYEEDWLSNMNDGKYQAMSRNAKMKYNINKVLLKLYEYRMVRYFIGRILDFVLDRFI